VAGDLKQVSATGDVTGAGRFLQSVVLTAGSDAATLLVKDGSGGATRLTLKAAANTSVPWTSGDPDGVAFSATIHATLSGTGPVASFEYS
jgi:hypothetical protein